MKRAGVTRTAAAHRTGAGTLFRLRMLLARRVWLPGPVYAAVPWIYLGAGITALVGGLYLPDGTWMIPYLVLLGLASIHGATAIASMRHRRRNRHLRDQALDGGKASGPVDQFPARPA